MKRSEWLPLTLMSAAMLTVSNPVDACGGCFAPPASETSQVTGHRMAFAISEDRTVLWDQFEYTGNPRDFSWVLPVAPGAYLEEAEDAWFEALEATTATRVTAPQLQCATTSGGCGLGSASADSAGGGFFDDGVTVIHRGTVGPYDTVTLRSENGNELRTWLDTNGYFVPSDIDPIIEAYVSEGADFIALKLQPGQGVQQMTPVRVVTPHGDPILPLRMVAAGTGQYVDIVLYVIGEGRFGMPDLEEATLDTAELEWDFATQESNYLDVRAEALRQHLGHTYLTTYARQGAFHEPTRDPSGFPVTYSVADTFGSSYEELASLYFAQAADNDGAPSVSCSDVVASLTEDALVVAETPAAGELAAERFECGGYDDLAAAMIGMRPSRVWLTRLELRLPREALAMDCVVEPASEQDAVDNQLLARKLGNRPDSCAEPVFTSRVAPGSGRPSSVVPWLIAVGLALGAARRWGALTR